jgi:hypothetical protein
MGKRLLGSLGISFALLVSTVSYISEPANAASPNPKVIFSSASDFVETSVLGDRLIIQNNSLDLFSVDSKMKSQKLITKPNSFRVPIQLLENFSKKVFTTSNSKTTLTTTSKIVSLDQNNQVKTVSIPVPKNNDYCIVIASLGQKLYVGCYWRNPKTYKFTNTLFALSPNGSVAEVKLPLQGDWRPSYLGSREIMFQLTQSGKGSTNYFYSLDENGNFTHQFNVVSTSLGTVKIVARTQNGWILQGQELIKTEAWDCNDLSTFKETFFVDGDGALSTLGTVGSNESVSYDELWISKGRIYFDREILDPNGCPIRADRYEVSQDGQSKKIASAATLNRKPSSDPIGESDLGLRWDLIKPSEQLIRWQAAFEICPSVSKGKAKGMTMFNGHAVCKEGGTLKAYPYPGWKMPEEPERIFPKIRKIDSNLQLELRKNSPREIPPIQLIPPIQPEGIGDPTWPVKCPAVIDTVKSPQPKILGFKFDGTGDVFTRLADGTSNVSKEPSNIVGCYVVLNWFLPNPKNANGFHIGTISRDESGYYWENASGVRWGLTLSGSILTTDKDNPYYATGRQFITF